MTIDALLTSFRDALNAATFSQVFTASIEGDPRIPADRMGSGWTVWIVPVDMKRTDGNRRRSRRDVSFDVGLLKRLDSTTEDQLLPCLLLSDEVQTFVDESLKQVDGHDLTEADFDPLYSAAHLKQQSVYVSVLSVTYRRTKAG